MKVQHAYARSAAVGAVLALVTMVADAAPPKPPAKDLAAEPYSAQVNFSALAPAVEVCHGSGPLVPAGKRFVIETVWANVTDPQGNPGEVPPNLYLFGVGVRPFIPLTLAQRPGDGEPPNDSPLWAGGLETRLFAGTISFATDDELSQAESSPRPCVQTKGIGRGVSVQFTGYLEPAPN